MIRLFIREWDRRRDCLQTTAEHDVVWSIWARQRRELSGAHLNGECQFQAKSHELVDAFLACPSDWEQDPLSLRADRGLPMPGWKAILSVWRILFRRLLPQTIDASKFPTFVGKFT